MTPRDFKDRLARRARRADLAVLPVLADKLCTYFQLLAAWNKKINLTGFDLQDPEPRAIDRLLIEPLVAARFIGATASQMIDIGSGGGSPAIPVCLANPRLRLLMVESKVRKSVFLAEAIRALEMTAAEVAAARFEELLTRPDLHERHDLLTMRAVRAEPRTLMSLQAFLRPGGTLFLFKSSTSDQPRDSVHPPLVWRSAHALLESSRSQLVVLEKQSIGRLRST